MPFSHEKLKAYQRAIDFVSWSTPLIEGLPASASVRNQLDRASTSIPLNLAEGNAKFSSRDRCRFHQIACGSAFECAACLDVIAARGFKVAEELFAGKELLEEIASLTMGLLNHFGARVQEDDGGYVTSAEQE